MIYKNKTFGQVIRDGRISIGRTLAEMADRLKVSVPYISEIERGNKAPPLNDIIERMAHYYHLDPIRLRLLANMWRPTIMFDMQHKGANQRKMVALIGKTMTDQTITDQQIDRMIKFLDPDGVFSDI